MQMLASIGDYGFWHYYLHTGDSATIAHAYPAVKRYLGSINWGACGLWWLQSRRRLGLMPTGGKRLMCPSGKRVALSGPRAAMNMADCTATDADVRHYNRCDEHCQ